jgi:peptidoglycan/LPS O-acetylase OafA/YrhL
MASVDPASSGSQRSSDGELSSPHLDALRILASAGIVILHYANYIEDTAVGRFVYTYTQHFNLFVDLFFTISGFVIASQYLGRVANGRSIGRFLWRRLARIYPLHLATLAFYVLIAVLFYFGLVRVENAARYPFSDLPAQILLLHAFDGQRLTFNFPSWSLSAEMFCYLLFPLVAFIGLRRPRMVIGLAVAAAVGNTLFVLMRGTSPWPDWINQGGEFRALPAFFLGMTLCLFRERVARASLGMILLPAFLLFIVAGWAFPVMASIALVYLIAIAAVHCDVAKVTTPLARLGLGRWAYLTYSTYMLHMPVATFVVTVLGRFLPHRPGMPLVLVLGAMVVLVFVSIASFRLFEDPVRRWLNAAFDRRRDLGPPPARALAPQPGRAS